MLSLQHCYDQSVPGRFSGSVDRGQWQHWGIQWPWISWFACNVQLQRYCWLHRFLLPCELLNAIQLCPELPVPNCQAFREAYSVSSKHFFWPLAGVCHIRVSLEANCLAFEVGGYLSTVPAREQYEKLRTISLKREFLKIPIIINVPF